MPPPIRASKTTHFNQPDFFFLAINDRASVYPALSSQRQRGDCPVSPLKTKTSVFGYSEWLRMVPNARSR
jgi:hypothetical protein